MTTQREDAITWPTTLSMSAFGEMGRFGNQLFQYAFLKICAEKSKAVVKCPDWVGSTLFGHADAPVTELLPPAIEGTRNNHSIFDEIPAIVAYIQRLHNQNVTSVGHDALERGLSNLDLYGFFQFHTRHYLPHKRLFRSLFQPVAELRKNLDSSLQRVRCEDRPLVGVHIRRGDYISEPRVGFVMSYPPQWYASWVTQCCSEFSDTPLVFVCSDDLDYVLPAFADCETISIKDFGADVLSLLSGSQFYADFYVLTQCDALLISNSTFSFVAAMLNERAKRFARPVWDLRQRFAEFDPWDSEPLLWPKGDESAFFKSSRDVLQLAYSTQGLTGLIRCLFISLPFSHFREIAIRSFLALRADRTMGIFRRILRSLGTA